MCAPVHLPSFSIFIPYFVWLLSHSLFGWVCSCFSVCVMSFDECVCLCIGVFCDDDTLYMSLCMLCRYVCIRWFCVCRYWLCSSIYKRNEIRVTRFSVSWCFFWHLQFLSHQCDFQMCAKLTVGRLFFSSLHMCDSIFSPPGKHSFLSLVLLILNFVQKHFVNIFALLISNLVSNWINIFRAILLEMPNVNFRICVAMTSFKSNAIAFGWTYANIGNFKRNSKSFATERRRLST